jgi:hypothetical protein
MRTFMCGFCNLFLGIFWRNFALVYMSLRSPTGFIFGASVCWKRSPRCSSTRLRSSLDSSTSQVIPRNLPEFLSNVRHAICRNAYVGVALLANARLALGLHPWRAQLMWILPIRGATKYLHCRSASTSAGVAGPMVVQRIWISAWSRLQHSPKSNSMNAASLPNRRVPVDAGILCRSRRPSQIHMSVALNTKLRARGPSLERSPRLCHVGAGSHHTGLRRTVLRPCILLMILFRSEEHGNECSH